jgi:hypothetical protein
MCPHQKTSACVHIVLPLAVKGGVGELKNTLEIKSAYFYASSMDETYLFLAAISIFKSDNNKEANAYIPCDRDENTFIAATDAPHNYPLL